jgi:hypothetical protein
MSVPNGRDRIALAGIWAPFLLLAHRFWFVSDDAFITFRYARNWVQGHGLRYNLGPNPPEEGFSNFLWVVVSAVFELLGRDPTFWVPLVSLSCGLVLLARVYRALQSLEIDRGVAFLSALVLACFPPFAVWGTGGLETMAFALAIFLTFDLLILRKDPAPVWAGVAGAAASLLRIEGVAWALLIAGLAFGSGLIEGRARSRLYRALGVYLAIVLAVFLAFFLARYRYYGLWFPNPVYTKIGFSSEVLLRGFRYVATFFLTFLTPFLVLPAAIVALSSRRAHHYPIVIMALAFPGYAIAVGGDWMTMGRFLVPGLAFYALLMGVALHWLYSRWPRLRPLAVLAVGSVIAVGLLPGWNFHLVPRTILARFRFMYFNPGFKTEYERWAAQNVKPGKAKLVGLALKRISQPGDSLVVGAIGAIGYYSELFIHDRFGLATREVALRPRGENEPIRAPGHDGKVSRSFFLHEHPTFLIHTVIEGDDLGRWVIEQANEWKTLLAGSLWRRYVPDLVELEGRPDAEAKVVVMVLRAIEEPPDDPASRVPRPERRRLRADRAEQLWNQFFERAKRLPGAHRPTAENGLG